MIWGYPYFRNPPLRSWACYPRHVGQGQAHRNHRSRMVLSNVHGTKSTPWGNASSMRPGFKDAEPQAELGFAENSSTAIEVQYLSGVNLFLFIVTFLWNHKAALILITTMPPFLPIFILNHFTTSRCTFWNMAHLRSLKIAPKILEKNYLSPVGLPNLSICSSLFPSDRPADRANLTIFGSPPLLLGSDVLGTGFGPWRVVRITSQQGEIGLARSELKWNPIFHHGPEMLR